MEIKKIDEKITLLKFPSAEDMNRAFCRVTGYLECPKFKGTTFTLGEYRKWYSAEYGSWSYDNDWSGHNIPWTGMEPFIEGLFDPLSEDEQVIVDLFKFKPKPFYIIAMHNDARSTVYDHELAHALYGTNPKYRAEVEAAIKPHWRKLRPVHELLKELGYSPKVFMDETHAYVGVDNAYLDDKKVKYPKELSNKLKSIFRKHCKC